MPAYSRAFADDEEIEFDLENTEPEEIPDNLPPEEKTYAKRYADLRRYSQSQLAKERKDKEDLQRQLQEASKSHLQLPSADDDAALDEWMQNYPDLARVLTRLSDRQAEKRTQDVKAQLEEIEAERKNLRVETSMQKLANAHPDFFTTLRTDEKFHQWLATKSKATQDIMYTENEDWQAASDVISLYKFENNITAPKANRSNTNREVVRDVPVRSRTTPSASTEYQFTESQIKKMSAEEYDMLEDKITEAWKNGKVLMDQTGGAR
jgi:hypothetical protein